MTNLNTGKAMADSLNAIQEQFLMGCTIGKYEEGFTKLYEGVLNAQKFFAHPNNVNQLVVKNIDEIIKNNTSVRDKLMKDPFDTKSVFEWGQNNFNLFISNLNKVFQVDAN